MRTADRTLDHGDTVLSSLMDGYTMGEKETGADILTAQARPDPAAGAASAERITPRASQAGMVSGRAADVPPPRDASLGSVSERMAGPGAEPGAEAAINNTKSNIKGLAGGGGAGLVAGDLDQDSAPELAATDGGIEHTDDWTSQAKAAPEKPPKTEIAVSDPGIPDRLAAPGGADSTQIAVSDEGVPADKPKPKSK